MYNVQCTCMHPEIGILDGHNSKIIHQNQDNQIKLAT